MEKCTNNDTMRQEVPSNAQIQAANHKTETGNAKAHPSRRPRRLIAIAAVLILALSTTAIAFGGEISAVLKRVSFGGSEATQVEPNIREDGHDYGNYRSFENRIAL